MTHIVRDSSPQPFRNQPLRARLRAGKIELTRNEGLPLETFKEMQRHRKPISPTWLLKQLEADGLELANLGVSVALELGLPDGRQFAVFTRRTGAAPCLALICGYWDASVDPDPLHAARRELLEEFIVQDDRPRRFILPPGCASPYDVRLTVSRPDWTFAFNDAPIEWLASASMRAVGLGR